MGLVEAMLFGWDIIEERPALTAEEKVQAEIHDKEEEEDD